MNLEEISKIKNTIRALDYDRDNIEAYHLFLKEQRKLQAIFSDKPAALKINGIRTCVFGDLIMMKGNDTLHKSRFFKGIKHEAINAIDHLVYV